MVPDWIKTSKTYLGFYYEKDEDTSDQEFDTVLLDGIEEDFKKFDLVYFDFNEIMDLQSNLTDDEVFNNFISLMKLFDFWEVVNFPYVFLDQLFNQDGYVYNEYLHSYLFFTDDYMIDSFTGTKVGNDDYMLNSLWQELSKNGTFLKLLGISKNTVDDLANYAIRNDNDYLLTYAIYKYKNKSYISPSLTQSYEIEYIIIDHEIKNPAKMAKSFDVNGNSFHLLSARDKDGNVFCSRIAEEERKRIENLVVDFDWEECYAIYGLQKTIYRTSYSIFLDILTKKIEPYFQRYGLSYKADAKYYEKSKLLYI